MRFTILMPLLAGAALAAASPAAAALATLYSNDFDGNVTAANGTVVAYNAGGAATTAIKTGPAFGFSGNALNNQTGGTPTGTAGTPTSFTFSNLAAHNQISIGFLLAMVDSWDGTGSATYEGDYLDLLIDGTVAATLSVANYDRDYTPPVLAGATELAFGDYYVSSYNDRLLDASTIGALTFNHTASTLTFGIQARGPGWQGSTDESWAIDNFRLQANLAGATGTVPEPATWAMMVGGFGLVGATLRRRRTAVRFA